MTEYDYSPEAYERYLTTQNRIAKWVDKTEQHRAEFQSTVAGRPQDLSRSGPGPVSHSRSSPSPPRHQQSGHPQPRQPVVNPPPTDSDSDSSDSYYEGPWPMPQQRPPMPLPQQAARHPLQQHVLSPPLVVVPPISPHRISHHHRHRSHDQRRSRSHNPPAYYPLASPPLHLGYQYSYPTVMSGQQGYVMMPPQYGGAQVPIMSSFSQPPGSAPVNMPATHSPGYFQPQVTVTSASATAYLQPNPAFLASNSRSSSPQQDMAWSTYGAPSPPAYSMLTTPAGTPPQSAPYIMGVPAYQPFVVQQPTQSSYIAHQILHQRVYDLSKNGSGKHYLRRSVG